MGAGGVVGEMVGLELWKKVLSGGAWNFRGDGVTVRVSTQL